MKFLEAESYQPLAREIFGQLRSLIQQTLPAARVEHIGSSSIQGAISKGDLDLFVGVEAEEFQGAIAAIESLGFRTKAESFRNETLCPFESDAYPLPVGLQLVMNRSEFECFLGFRDRMNADADLRSEYNQLKARASNLNEDEYRSAKSNFIESVLSRRPVLFKTARFTAQLLSVADLALVIQLNNTCSDFFLFQNGVPPGEGDAREIFEQVPSASTGVIKLPIGIFSSERLVGVLDVLRGYRTNSEWYIGFMLLAPSFRGQGLGTEIHNEFVRYARSAGAHRFLLAVLEANEAARRFWLRLGYSKIKDYPPRQFGNRLHGLAEYEMNL
ncbi:MAG: GNAT family N-acetyltransferase [Verrucomicrobia bacterium]|nr:GNAT family N-acetyltransferase [Verrucomicrobiota bacterium]